ncbi:hypothetical protein AB0B45_16615 [Nonomuraea sp. NPDC049152]|uniref:hypothetical protein n=1 Tax=Nonomuraea sp. NPDC049152 TaxID=3154350 RepID=UPI00340B07AE
MGFEAGWIAHPTYPERPSISKAENREALLAFDKIDDGGFGEEWPITGTQVAAGDLEVDPDVWKQKDNVWFVSCNYMGLGEIWVARHLLGDPSYELTAVQIRKAYEGEEGELAHFWNERKAEMEPDGPRATLTLTGIMSGRRVSDNKAIDVPAGTYQSQGTEPRKVYGERQLAPFSVIVLVNGERIMINPDDFFGHVDAHNVEARQQNLNVEINAATIRELFTGTTSIVAPYVPQGHWLTDAHVHYVTPAQMGAVFVRKTMPESEQAVQDARAANPALFDVGVTTPGVRFGDHIFILLDELGIGVEYHEAVHRLSHPATLAILGFGFNEGVTEYFTRELFKHAARPPKVVRPDDQYMSQREAVEALLTAEAFTPHDLAEAYFMGDIQPLFTKAAARLGRQFSLQAYAQYVRSSHASAAVKVLEVLAD